MKFVDVTITETPVEAGPDLEKELRKVIDDYCMARVGQTANEMLFYGLRQEIIAFMEKHEIFSEQERKTYKFDVFLGEENPPRIITIDAKFMEFDDAEK